MAPPRSTSTKSTHKIWYETIKFGVSPCFSQRFWHILAVRPVRSQKKLSLSSPPICGINLKQSLLPGAKTMTMMCSHHFSSAKLCDFEAHFCCEIIIRIFQSNLGCVDLNMYFFLIPFLVPKILAELP